MKCALLVGINYTSVPGVTLSGCIDDVVNMKTAIVSKFGYNPANVVVLRDDVMTDVAHLPTKANILACLRSLISKSNQCTEIWVHYSGHGSQRRLGPPRLSNEWVHQRCRFVFDFSSGQVSYHDLDGQLPQWQPVRVEVEYGIFVWECIQYDQDRSTLDGQSQHCHDQWMQSRRDVGGVL